MFRLRKSNRNCRTTMGPFRVSLIAAAAPGPKEGRKRQKATRWGDKEFKEHSGGRGEGRAEGTEIIKSISGEQLEQDSSWQQHLGVRSRQPGAALLLRFSARPSPPRTLRSNTPDPPHHPGPLLELWLVPPAPSHTGLAPLATLT